MRNLRSRAKLFRSSETTGLPSGKTWACLGSVRLCLGIPDQSWGPGTGSLGGTPGRGWDHLGLCGDTQHQHPRGASVHIDDSSLRLLEEAPRPRLRASGQSLIGYGAVRLRSGRPLFLCVFDKDVLFTSVMTFFHVSIEMGAPSASFGVFALGFPWTFTAWVSPGSSRRGFPRVFTACGRSAPPPFPSQPPWHGLLLLRASVISSPVEGASAGLRFTWKRTRMRSTSGTWNSIRTTTYSSFPDQGKRLFQVCLHKRASYDRNRTETLE